MRNAYYALLDAMPENDSHAQRLLLQEMKRLDEYARGRSIDGVWKDYLDNKELMDADLDNLRKSAGLVFKAANDIAEELDRKRDNCNAYIKGAIDGTGNKNIDEFELRLRSGSEAINNQNVGGSWPVPGTGKNSWPYLHHGDPGWASRDYNNWHDVKLDIEGKVIWEFKTAIETIDRECMAAHVNIQRYASKLAEALNAYAPHRPLA